MKQTVITYNNTIYIQHLNHRSGTEAETHGPT